MPDATKAVNYEIKMADNMYCVHRAGSDTPITNGCKSTRKAAETLIRSILTGKGRKMKQMPFRQTEVAYTTVSPQTGVSQCANCRFFIPAGAYIGADIDDSPTDVCSCALIEGYPLPILPTGYCNRFEAIPPDANAPEPMEVVIVEPEVSVTEVTDTEGDTTQMMYVSPLPVKQNALKRLLGFKDPDGITIFRGENGLRRAVHVVSNGYKDREEEHVATKALEEYVQSQYKEGAWAGDNVLDFFHEVDIGDIIAAAMIDGFLVEVSQERADSVIASKLWDYWQTTTNDRSVQWGTSHEFKAKKSEDTFVRIKKSKTSVLPVQSAANLYTISEVLPMSENAAFAEHLDKALGLEGASKILAEKGINALNEKLRKAGEQAKGIRKADATAEDTPPEEKADPTVSIDFTPLLTELMNAISTQQAALDTTVEADANKQKKLSEQASQIATLTKEVNTLKTWRETIMKDTPRSAGLGTSTVLSGNEEEEARKKIEERNTTFDPLFPGMNVPLSQNGAK